MSKRLSELEAEAKRQQIEIQVEKERLQQTESFFPILDEDLESWRLKLSKEAMSPGENQAAPPEAKWKLVFFSRDYRGYEQMAWYSYGPDKSSPGWSSQKWFESEQNCGGWVIAYAGNPEALIPPPLALKRLSIFSFVFVICRVEKQLPTHSYNLNYECSHFTFGMPGLFKPSTLRTEVPPTAGIDKPDLENLEHIEILYQHSIKSKGNFIGLDDQLRILERDFVEARTKLIKEKEYAQRIFELRK